MGFDSTWCLSLSCAPSLRVRAEHGEAGLRQRRLRVRRDVGWRRWRVDKVGG